MLSPVLKKEIKTSTRTWKTPLLVMIYVGILSGIMAFVLWAEGFDSYSSGIEPSFVSDLFVGLAFLQLSLVLFISPALTAAAISGERQRSTLDVLLSTRLSTKSIVVGKLLAGLYKVFMLIVASIPVFSIIYMFGGISITNLIIFIVICMVAALMMGSIGILMSSLLKKTTTATAITYAILLFLTLGTITLTGASYLVAEAYSSGSDPVYALMYIHPFAPLSVFMDLNLGLGMDFLSFGYYDTDTVGHLMITISIQLIISLVCILLAAKRINPIHKIHR